jgi:hypothetical protein
MDNGGVIIFGNQYDTKLGTFEFTSYFKYVKLQFDFYKCTKYDGIGSETVVIVNSDAPGTRFSALGRKYYRVWSHDNTMFHDFTDRLEPPILFRQGSTDASHITITDNCAMVIYVNGHEYHTICKIRATEDKPNDFKIPDKVTYSTKSALTAIGLFNLLNAHAYSVVKQEPTPQTTRKPYTINFDITPSKFMGVECWNVPDKLKKGLVITPDVKPSDNWKVCMVDKNWQITFTHPKNGKLYVSSGYGRFWVIDEKDEIVDFNIIHIELL